MAQKQRRPSQVESLGGAAQRTRVEDLTMKQETSLLAEALRAIHKAEDYCLESFYQTYGENSMSYKQTGLEDLFNEMITTLRIEIGKSVDLDIQDMLLGKEERRILC